MGTWWGCFGGGGGGGGGSGQVCVLGGMRLSRHVKSVIWVNGIMGFFYFYTWATKWDGGVGRLTPHAAGDKIM